MMIAVTKPSILGDIFSISLQIIIIIIIIPRCKFQRRAWVITMIIASFAVTAAVRSRK